MKANQSLRAGPDTKKYRVIFKKQLKINTRFLSKYSYLPCFAYGEGLCKIISDAQIISLYIRRSTKKGSLHDLLKRPSAGTVVRKSYCTLSFLAIASSLVDDVTRS
jgi:hypothetical protein